jgi:hypothetical protein
VPSSMEWHEIFAEANVFDPGALRNYWSRLTREIRIGLTMRCREQGLAS